MSISFLFSDGLADLLSLRQRLENRSGAAQPSCLLLPVIVASP
jgi:hypothetical protein